MLHARELLTQQAPALVQILRLLWQLQRRLWLQLLLRRRRLRLRLLRLLRLLRRLWLELCSRWLQGACGLWWPSHASGHGNATAWRSGSRSA